MVDERVKVPCAAPAFTEKLCQTHGDCGQELGGCQTVDDDHRDRPRRYCGISTRKTARSLVNAQASTFLHEGRTTWKRDVR
jgi:hypothetical protein